MGIRTKTFNYGNECEAEWPSRFGSGAGKGGRFAVDKETGEVGPKKFVPRPEVNAPSIRVDSCLPYQHPATGKWVESRSTAARITKEAGFEDRTGEVRVADNTPRLKEMSDDDYVKDVQIAREMCISGIAPLTEYDKEVCKRMDENLKNRV